LQEKTAVKLFIACFCLFVCVSSCLAQGDRGSISGAGLLFTDNGRGGHIRPKARKRDFGANLGGPVYIPKPFARLRSR
jgi:hypothetical protein